MKSTFPILFTPLLTVVVQFSAVTFLLPLLPTYRQGAWLEVAFALTQILGLMTLGALADRRGFRATMRWCLLLQAVGLSLLFIPQLIVPSRFLSGYASAILPCVIGWIATSLPPEHQLRANAQVMLAVTIGAGLGTSLSGLLPHPYGLLSLLTACSIIFFLFRYHRPTSPFLPPSTPWRTLDPRKLSSQAKRLALVFLFTSTGFHSMRALLPFLLSSPQHIASILIGLTLSIGMIQLLLSLFPPRLHLTHLLRLALGIFFIGLSSLALSALSPLSLGFLIALLCIAISIGIADPAGGALLGRLNYLSHAGKQAGIVLGIGAIGKILGPLLTAMALFLQHPTSSLLFGALLVLTAFFLIPAQKTSPVLRRFTLKDRK